MFKQNLKMERQHNEHDENYKLKTKLKLKGKRQVIVIGES